MTAKILPFGHEARGPIRTPEAFGGIRVKSTVLVVEDAAGAETSSSSLLTAEGYDVASVPDIEEALKAVAKRPPDAILFGVLEPANGAVDFIRRLALGRHAVSVPVVIITALNEFQLGSFLNGVPGIRRILYSPCPPDDLRKAMARAVRYSKH